MEFPDPPVQLQKRIVVAEVAQQERAFAASDKVLPVAEPCAHVFGNIDGHVARAVQVIESFRDVGGREGKVFFNESRTRQGAEALEIPGDVIRYAHLGFQDLEVEEKAVVDAGAQANSPPVYEVIFRLVRLLAVPQVQYGIDAQVEVRAIDLIEVRRRFVEGAEDGFIRTFVQWAILGSQREVLPDEVGRAVRVLRRRERRQR